MYPSLYFWLGCLISVHFINAEKTCENTDIVFETPQIIQTSNGPVEAYVAKNNRYIDGRAWTWYDAVCCCSKHGYEIVSIVIQKDAEAFLGNRRLGSLGFWTAGHKFCKTVWKNLNGDVYPPFYGGYNAGPDPPPCIYYNAGILQASDCDRAQAIYDLVCTNPKGANAGRQTRQSKPNVVIHRPSKPKPNKVVPPCNKDSVKTYASGNCQAGRSGEESGTGRRNRYEIEVEDEK